MRRTGMAVAVAALALALAAGCGGEREGTGAGGSGAPPAAPGALLLTVDTFRADRAGCLGYPGGLTPVLDRIARRGFLARDAFAPAPLTAVSHATMLTGLDPPHHGVRENTLYVLADSLTTLAARFTAAGFRTGGFIAALPLEGRFGFRHGFEHFDDDVGPPGDSRSYYAERPAAEVVDAALAWARGLRRDERWFLWAHFFDPHEPRNVPRELRRFPAEGDYEREIRSMDLQIGRLLRGLAEMRGELPWIAVLSDHGEALGDHGETSHGVLLFGETIHGLFAVAPPEEGAGAWLIPHGILPGIVRYADLTPTLLDALGIDAPGGLDGRSLLREAPEGRGAYGEAYYTAIQFHWSPLLSWRDERWTYIEGPEPELYDRSADPGELANVIGAHPEVAERFSKEIARIERDPQPASTPELDPETEEQLLALGYLSGGGELRMDRTKNPRKLVRAVNQLFRGIVLMSDGRADAALPLLQSAYRADPENSVTLFHLADCLRNLGDRPTAMAYYRRSVELDPRNAEAFGHLAILEFERNDRDEALRLLEEGLRESPTSFPLLMTSGDLYAELGRRDEAAAFYRRAAESQPRRPEPKEKLEALAAARSGR